MSTTQTMITIALISFGTMLTRFIPFILFPDKKEPPAYIKYLGTVLPFSVIGMLVVYCLKDTVASELYGLPEAISIFAIFLLHRWKKNSFLSIAGGTAIYMLLVQFIF